MNSTNFTRFSAAVMMAALAVGSLSAKDIYLSADGNDTNTGLTADSPRKTLFSLNEGGTSDNATNQRIVRSGDVIHISGILKMSDERAAVEAAGLAVKANIPGQFHIDGDDNNPTHTGFYINSNNSRQGYDWCGITFEGENPETDGFDGEMQSRIFDLANPNNQMWVFKNLSFKNGLMPKDGGGAVLLRGGANARFENCVFDNCHYDESKLTTATEGGMDLVNAGGGVPELGGAIRIESVKSVEFDGCVFTRNWARFGGAMFIGGDNVKIANCLFENNKAQTDGGTGKYIRNTRGGAIACRPQWSRSCIDIDNTVFVGNSAYNDGGALCFTNDQKASNRYIDLNMTNCYVAKNECIWENGGALSITWNNWPGGKVFAGKFGNCTFYNNCAGSYGGMAFVRGGVEGSELTFVNCTMVGNHQNHRRDTNAGHCGGIVFDDSDCELYVNGEKQFAADGKTALKQPRFVSDNICKRFLNCIMEDNYNYNPGKDNHFQYNDVSFLGSYRTVYGTETAKANLVFDHTCVGRTITGVAYYKIRDDRFQPIYDEEKGKDKEESVKAIHKDNFPNCDIQYMSNKQTENHIGYLADSTEYIHKENGSHKVWGVLPIVDGDMGQKAAEMGDAAHWVLPERTVELTFPALDDLKAEILSKYGEGAAKEYINAGDFSNQTLTIRGLDISATDGNGVPRENCRYKIGATTLSQKAIDEGLEKDETTGIDAVAAAADELTIAVEGDILSVAGADNAVISIYGTSGTKVIEARGTADLSALAAGVYVVTAREGAKHTVAKIMK